MTARLWTLYLFLLLPLINYSQTFYFNGDGTASPVMFTTEKSAGQIYTRVLEWLDKVYFGKSELALSDFKQDEYILFKGSIWNIFQKDVYYDTRPKYVAGYSMLITIREGHYTIQYTHNDFKNQNREPLAFGLNEVLNDLYPDIGQDALKNYEFNINRLFEALNYYIENGKLINRSSPEKFPVVFKFNEDGSSDAVTSTSNKTPEELYEGILTWARRKFGAFPKKVVTASSATKTISVDCEDWNVFEKEFNNDDLSRKRYSARYTLEFKVRNGGYTVNVIHDAFLIDAEFVALALKDVTENKSTDPNLEGAKEAYEYNISKKLYSLKQYLDNP